MSYSTRQFYFKDKLGVTYSLLYYKNPQFNQADNFAYYGINKKTFLSLCQATFPWYSPDLLDQLLSKFEKARFFDLVFSLDDQLVGFHIYKIDYLSLTKNNLSKIMYVDHAATHPDFEGRGLTIQGRLAVFEHEDPDIFCGSSANPAIYAASQKVASKRGFNFFPKSSHTPEKIFHLAKLIHDKLSLRNATLNKKLIRTYKTLVSKGHGSHPLHSVLPLTAKQHIFYLALTPALTNFISTPTVNSAIPFYI